MAYFRISKYSSHSICNICIALNSNRRQCKSETELKVSKDLINQHKMTFGGANRKIQEFKQSALSFPSDNLYLQVDGMDNHKSYLPRKAVITKTLSQVVISCRVQGFTGVTFTVPK